MTDYGRASQFANETWQGIYRVERADSHDGSDYRMFRIYLHSSNGPIKFVAVGSVNTWNMSREDGCTQ